MKNIPKLKTILKAAVVIAVALAFVMPGAAVFTHTTPKDELNFWDGKTKIPIKEITTWDKKPAPAPLIEGENIQISGWDPSVGDDVRPTITKDKQGDVFITWQNNADVSTSNAGFAFCPEDSVLDQATWWENGVILSIEGVQQLEYPGTALCEHPAYQLMGVFLGVDTEVIGGYYIPDMNYDNWVFYSWDNGAPEPKYAKISDGGFYDDKNYPGTIGPFNMFIHREVYQSFDIPDCPICFHTGIDAGAGASYFDGQSGLKTAPAKDPDMVNFADRFFTVLQYTNETTGPHIVWTKTIPATEPDYEYTPYKKYIADGTNPAIAAYGDGEILAVVYVNATGAIRCAYSNDEGETFSNSTIAAAGNYPDIYAHKNQFYAAYITEGDLYVTNSTDSGATWNTPLKINNQDGTVVAEENAIDIHDGGIVWIDSRNADKDIYYYQLFLPTPMPKLEVSITKGFGTSVKAVVNNTGKAIATNIKWEIKVTGGILGRIAKTSNGTIPSLAVNESATITSDMIFGLGSISITATATCDEGVTATPATASGTQLIIFTIVK